MRKSSGVSAANADTIPTSARTAWIGIAFDAGWGFVTSNVCKACTPRMMNKPSGRRLCHEWTCPDHPGEPISAKEYVGKGVRIDRILRRGFRGIKS